MTLSDIPEDIEFASNEEKTFLTLQAIGYCDRHSLPEEEIIPTIRRWAELNRRDDWEGNPLIRKLYFE